MRISLSPNVRLYRHEVQTWWMALSQVSSFIFTLKLIFGGLVGSFQKYYWGFDLYASLDVDILSNQQQPDWEDDTTERQEMKTREKELGLKRLH